MTATIKLDEERKNRLEKFVASLLVREGLKVTLQDALGLIVDYSLAHEEEIVQRLRSLPPLERDPAWLMLDSPDDWGVEDASMKVDEYLYGG